MNPDQTDSKSLPDLAGIVDQMNSGESPAEIKEPKPAAEFPNRYSIRDVGGDKMLSCVEAPNLNVQIKFGFSVSAAAMNKSPSGTIYLDGVVQNGPCLDNARQIYNFDHHEGCVRAFTLSTCEQVLVMLKKGFDLRGREWKIIANDPDLDTVLAIWLLLNHIRISEKESIREHILFPLIRLEGAIDALGLELKALTALPATQINQSQRIIDHLRRKELQMKKGGQWGEQTNFIAYTSEMLKEIDQIIYETEKFGDLLGIEELARVNLPNNHQAVVVQSDMGIYEIEPLLKKIYGASIGLAILRRTPAAYTLRQVDPFLTGSLEDVYARLNFMDPAVKCRTQDRWGGSSDIGGSPRERGTQLTPAEIAKACQDAFQRHSFVQRSMHFCIVALSAFMVLGISEIFAAYWPLDMQSYDSWIKPFVQDPHLKFSISLMFLSTLLLAGVSRRRLWQFGIISPVGKIWWCMLPVAVLGTFAGGTWVPVDSLSYQLSDISRLVLTVALSTLSLEYLFRGLLHGLLAQKSKIQSCYSRFFTSWPNGGTAILYAVFMTMRTFSQTDVAFPFSITPRQGAVFIAAFFFSLVLGFVRERSHSIFSSFMIHLIAVLSFLLLPDLFIYASHLSRLNIFF